MKHTFTSLRRSLVIIGLTLAGGTLWAKNPPEPAPTPDPALELSPTQDREIKRINDYFDQSEKPVRALLKSAREEYKLAVNAKPVDNAKVQEKLAAAQKAATLLATEEALHRANVLVLLTPPQRKMVETLELTGKEPATGPANQSTERAH
ncbi:MAG: periplasmic heavy metal sensor [Verrucomicrobia bacterium]|nr:periplasmic heavy metal sensor [Verrucomicrobiota bacterium]